MKKILIIIPLIMLLIAAGILLKKRRQEVAELPVPTVMIPTVRTTLPQVRTLSQTHRFLAELKTTNNAAISSKLSGRISQLLVHENQQVRKGELLVKIDDREILAGIKALQAQLTAANSQMKYTQTQYERNLALYQAGGLAQEKLEASAVAMSAATASTQDLQQKINSLKNQHDYLNIKASFSGIIGNIYLRQGDLATPGRPILNLNSLFQKLTISFVPDRVIIQPGQIVLHNNKRIGVVKRLYNEAQNGLSVAEIIPDQRLDLPSGSYLTLEVVTKSATGCALPLQALLHRHDGVSVMQYQQDHFSEVPVNVQLRNAEFALVTPCPTQPVALATEAKLSLLPGYSKVNIIAGAQDE